MTASTPPLPLGTRIWFAWVCFFRVLFDGAFAARVVSVREARHDELAAPPDRAPAERSPDGAIESVSTDHAPSPMETKRRPMLQASAGMPGLESFLSGIVTGGLARDFPLADLIGHVTWRPADR